MSMVEMEMDDEQMAELIHRIQMHVYVRRIRCRELFTDFDKLRCGRCTVINFVRGLDRAGFKLTDEEADALAYHYTEHGARVLPPAVVNYYKFCADVDKVFADEELQETMKAMSMTCSPGNTMLATFQPNSIEDEERVYHVMHRLAALCKARGLTIKMCYSEIDRNNGANPSRFNPLRSGKVTKAQFIRHFPFKKEMSPDDIEVICERYATERGDVHFIALHNDISEVLPDPQQPFPTSPLLLRPDGTRWSHQALPVVKKICAKVVEKRCRLREHFGDFDALRKGYCTPGQLKTVFTIMGLSKDVDKADFDTILSLYTNEEGLFRYRDFCDEIEQAFAVGGLERSPLARIDMPDATTTAPARRNPMRLTDAKLMKIRHIEEKIRTYVRKRRCEMKPMFTDFDKANRGYVTRTQFQRIMSMMHFTGIDEHAVSLLAGIYCDFGNWNDFNYITFLKSIDPPANDVEVAMLQMTSPHIPFKPRPYFDERGRVIPKSFVAPRSRSTPML